MKIDLNKLSFEDFDALHRNGYITDDDAERAKQIVGKDFKYDFWLLTLADLGCLMSGILPPAILKLFNKKSISTAEFLRRNNAFEYFIEEFLSILDKLNIKETSKERQASVGLPIFQKNEGMLVFTRNYFGLKSFSEAENVTLADFYLAKKDTFARQTFERNMQTIMSRNRK